MNTHSVGRSSLSFSIPTQPISSETARDLASLGCNLSIRADSKFSDSDVKDIAVIMQGKKSHLTLHGILFNADTLKEIALALRDKVTIIV